MFAFAPFGLIPFALPAAESRDSVVGERIGGDVIEVVNRVTSAAFVGLEVVQTVLLQREKVTDLLIEIEQTVRVLPVRVIELAQRVEAALSKRLPFSGANAYNDEDYTFRMTVGGEEVSICALFDEFTLSMGEDEAAVVNLLLKPREARGVSIDLYQFINKELVIDVVRKSGDVRVFTGLVDACSADDLIAGQRISLSATDARERKLNLQPRSWVEKIGHFSPLVFKKPEEYDFQSEEVTDRLSTIPFSIEWFEGNPYITPLRPKAVPDFVIGACDVWAANPPALGLSSSERHINAAELTLQIQSQIAYQREMQFGFDSGYSICEYFTHGRPPLVAAVKSAAEGAGWVVNNFSYQGLLPNQMVQCSFMSRPNYWGASQTGYLNDNGKRTIEDLTDLYAHKAYWNGYKRWMQPTEEKYKIRVQHAGSIAQFGEQKKQYSLSISNEVDQIKDDKEIVKWEDWESYQQPSDKFQRITGGYARWLNQIEAGTDTAIQCVMAQMSVDILKSHRDGCTLEMKFAPEIDLRHTVYIDIPNLKLFGKVSAVQHTVDLERAKGVTQIEVKYFANGLDVDQDFAVAPLPLRGKPEFYVNPKLEHSMGTERISMGDLVVEKEGDYEGGSFMMGGVFRLYKAEGNIVREYRNLLRNDVKLYKFEQFIVRTPEIEKESTDTMDITLPEQVFEIGIFNNAVEVVL